MIELLRPYMRCFGNIFDAELYKAFQYTPLESDRNNTLRHNKSMCAMYDDGILVVV